MSEPFAVPTANSSPFLSNSYWCPADSITEAGAVIIDRDSELVLLVYDETRVMYTLPRDSVTEMDELMQVALRAAERKTGLRCEQLPLPRMGKYTVVPPDGNWGNAKAQEVYVRSETTTNPFLVAFGTVWRQSPQATWPEGFQLITFWFSGFIKVGRKEQPSPPTMESQQPRYLLLPITDALRRLDSDDKAAWTALSQFHRIWQTVKRMPAVRQ